MRSVSHNLDEVRLRVTEACKKSGRDSQSIQLIAVSKNLPELSIRNAFEAGQIHFAESRIQEAETKIAALPKSLKWHFIGGLQSNKLRRIIHHFDVIHSVDSFRIASYINGIAGELGLRVKVFIQVNIGSEESKKGFDTSLMHSEMEAFLKLDCLEILGLMCIPPNNKNSEETRRWFVALRELRDVLEDKLGVSLPALSMGMSNDFEVAIEEGATHVRVGSAIFGNRSSELK